MRLITTLLVGALLPSIALAHGGGLNAEGCHTNRKTGEYHCHRAPAAQPKVDSRFRAEPRAFGARTEKGFTCSGKTTCKQMTSCEEARFYLTECGVYRLDGDGDGMPCESLCF